MATAGHVLCEGANYATMETKRMLCKIITVHIFHSTEAKRANFQNNVQFMQMCNQTKGSNNYNRLLQKEWWIGTKTCSNASTAVYVILSLECFPLR